MTAVPQTLYNSRLMKMENAIAIGAEMLIESPTPEIDARLLLEHVLALPHGASRTQSAIPLNEATLDEFLALVARAEKKEPIPYVVGKAPFRYLELTVTPAVLIPRPETEMLVDLALRWAGKRPSTRVIDVGTGSGCIAISLATEKPTLQVEAVDISAESLTIARQNAQDNNANIIFHHGDLLEPVAGPFDIIIANLPYITDLEWTTLDDGVKLHEPATALRGGRDGLDIVRRLLEQATSKLCPNGLVLLEIGWRQGAATCELARKFFPDAAVDLITDYGGQDRIVKVERTA